MEFVQYYSQNVFAGFANRFKKSPQSWQIVEVCLTGKTQHNSKLIAKKIKSYFDGNQGVIIPLGQSRLVVIVETGAAAEPSTVAKALDKALPEHSCKIEATSLTPEGVRQLRIRLGDMDENLRENALFTTRRERAQKIAMIVDDDLFIRSVLKKAIGDSMQIVEMTESTDVVETYLEVLPDIVFMDIHLPGQSGIDILSELSDFDDTAYVIIMSGDSTKDNVLVSKKTGAKGFLSKPLVTEKVTAHIGKCPTILV